MQIEKPAATNKKNLTTDVNLEFIIETLSKLTFCYYCVLLEFKSERNIVYKPRVS